jgi:hypothetical protein
MTTLTDPTHEQFVQLIEDSGPGAVLETLIHYAESVDDAAYQELSKDLKRVYHRFRVQSGEYR